MQQLIVFALLGLGASALIAGLAVAVVIQYRGSGMVNLASGAIATFGAYLFYSFRVQAGWPAVPAFAAGLVGCLALGAAFELLVVRKLRAESPLAKLIASLGLLLALQALFVIRFGTSGQASPSLFGTSSVTVFKTPIPLDNIVIAGIVVALTIVVSLGYRFTRLGLATRAAAENEEGAILLGLAPDRISMYNTLLATMIAGAVGMFAAAETQLDPTTMGLAIVPALAAALLGGFSSFGTAAAAGLGIGTVEALLVYLQTKSWFPTVQGNQLPGVAALFTCVVVVGTLWFRGAKLPTRGALRERPLPPAPEPSRFGIRPVLLIVLGVVLCFVLPAEFRQGLMYSLIGMVICLALVIIIGYVGQVSLMHTALAGVAAFAVEKLTVQAGIAFPFSPILAVGAAVLFGLFAAIPSLRLRGVTLAIATLAAAVAIEQFGFDNTTFGQDASGSIVPAPTIFGLHLGPGANFPFWDGKLPSPVPVLLCLATAVAVALIVAGLRRSTFGQQMLAVRSNEAAAAATGVNVHNTKVVAFAVSAGIAGIAGVMTAYSLGSVNASEFDVWIGLSFVAFAYIGGVTTIRGAIIAGTLFPAGITGVALQQWTGLGIDWLNLIGGVGLLFNVVFAPQGIALAKNAPHNLLFNLVRRQRPPADHPVPVADDRELVSR